MLNVVISQANSEGQVILKSRWLDALNGTLTQPLHCMMTSEVTQAQPF